MAGTGTVLLYVFGGLVGGYLAVGLVCFGCAKICRRCTWLLLGEKPLDTKGKQLLST